MPTTDCLDTILENTSGQTRYFSFLPVHGKVLTPGEQVSFLGTAADAIGTLPGGERKLEALQQSLLAGDITIVQAPSPILRDSSVSTINKAVEISGGVPAVGPVCSGSLLPTLVGNFDARVLSSMLPSLGDDEPPVVRLPVPGEDLIAIWGDVESSMNPGWSDPFAPLSFQSAKVPPLITKTIDGQEIPFICFDGIDDLMLHVAYVKKVITLPSPPFSGNPINILLGTKNPIDRNPAGWTIQIIAGGAVAAGTGTLFSMGFDFGSGSRFEFQVQVNASEEAGFEVYPLGTMASAVTSSFDGSVAGPASLITYSQDNANGTARLWVDGVAIDSLAFSGFDITQFPDVLSEGPPSFPSMVLGAGLNVDISIVRIYDGPMDQEQLQESAADLETDYDLTFGDFS